MAKQRSSWNELMSKFAHAVTLLAGSSGAFVLALLVIVIWIATGPIFGYSDTWQLVINTGTTIVTFLMVFLIQRSQNKDSRAVHLKLNEIVAGLEGASNRLIDVESLTDEDLETLHLHFSELVRMAKSDHNLLKSHSVEEAHGRHETKSALRRK